MSEESTPTETPSPVEAAQQAAETPAPEQPAQTETIEVTDQKFKVDGQEYTSSQIAEQTRELEMLREYQKAAGNLMKAETVEMTAERESDMRFVMAYEGYEENQINQQIENIKMATNSEQPQNNGVVPHQSPEASAQEPVVDPRVDEMEQRVQTMEAREKQMRVQQLESKLNDAVNLAQGGEEISKITSSFKRIHGDEGHSERMDILGEDIHREMVSYLRKVRSGGGSISDDAIKQASEMAADTVAKRYRTVIGDPDKLGRSPETATGQTQFFQKKPVEAPNFIPGKDSSGSTFDKARKFAEDTLLDIAHDVSAGGNTKL